MKSIREVRVREIRILRNMIALSLLFSATAHSQVFEPAELGNILDVISAEVAPPTLPEKAPVISVYCQTDVAVSGALGNLACYEKDGFDQVRDATEAALLGKSFKPATVDGKAVPVRMVFRVVYAEREGQPPVMVLPNLGNMQNTYGLHYSAPQERLDKQPWYEAYKANEWSRGQMFFSNDGRLTRFIAVIDEQGKPVAVRRIEASKHHKRDAIELEKQLKQSQFIPGMADGKPQRMNHVAVLHYPN